MATRERRLREPQLRYVQVPAALHGLLGRIRHVETLKWLHRDIRGKVQPCRRPYLLNNSNHLLYMHPYNKGVMAMALLKVFLDSLIKRMNEHCKGMSPRCDGSCCGIGYCQRVWDAVSGKGMAER